MTSVFQMNTQWLFAKARRILRTLGALCVILLPVINQLISFFQKLHDDFIITQWNRTNAYEIRRLQQRTKIPARFFIVTIEGSFICRHIILMNKVIFNIPRCNIVFVYTDAGLFSSVTEWKHRINVDVILDLLDCHVLLIWSDQYNLKPMSAQPKLVNTMREWGNRRLWLICD